MTSIKEVLVRCAEELEESIENEGKLASFKQAAAMARSALAQLDSADARSGNLRRVVLDLLNGVTPAVENLACHQEQADADGCMVKVSRQALDEVLSAVNEVAVQAATSLSTGLLPNASPGNGAEKVREALDGLIQYVERNECRHEETSRGGSIWTICDECGQKWADDRGGFIPYQEPSELASARTALHSTSAAGETTSSDGGGCMADFSSGDPNNLKELMAGPSVFDPPSEAADVLAMKEACKRAVSECLNQYGRMTFVTEKGWSGLEGQIRAAIDKLSPEGKAEGGRGEPVAIKPLEWDKHPDEDEWFSHDHGLYDVSEYLVYKSPVSTTAWCLKVRGILLDEDFLGPDAAKAAARDDYEQRIRSALYTHPASPPDVEAIARIIDPEAFEKWDDAQGSWRKDEAKVACWPAEEKADAIAALIAGGR